MDRYWKELASLITGDPGEPPDSPEDAPAFARKMFQEGVTLIMAEEDRRGKTYLQQYIALFRAIPQEARFYHDWISLYISLWIVDPAPPEPFFTKAVDSIKRTAKRLALHYQSLDLVRPLVEIRLMDVKDETRLNKAQLNHTTDDRFAYENMADLLVEAARIHTITEDYARADKILDRSYGMYKTAMEKLEDALIAEHPRWKKVRKYHHRHVPEKYSKTARKYFAERQRLAYNIPFFRKQRSVLSAICRHGGQAYKSTTPKFKKKFDRFMKSIIPNEKRLFSPLGFVELLEWILIRRNVCPHIEKQAPSHDNARLLRMLFEI